MKKHFFLFIPLFYISCQLFAQNFVVTDSSSDVSFTIKNLGLTVNGSFKGLKGNIHFDRTELSNATFEVSVAVATINTGIEARDKHLKKEEYFDLVKFPVITFLSKKITKSTTSGILTIEGDITIKGITKAISFPFIATPVGDDYLFTGEFALNRRDFGVGGSSVVLSDNLTVSLAVLARHK